MDLKVHTCFNVTRRLTGVDEKTTTTHLLTAIASSFNFPGCWYLALQNPMKKDDITLLKANDKPLIIMGRMRKKMVLWAFLEEDITNNNPIIFNNTNINFCNSLNKNFINSKTYANKNDNIFKNNWDKRQTDNSKDYLKIKSQTTKNSAPNDFVKNKNSIESHKSCTNTHKDLIVDNDEKFSNEEETYSEGKTVEEDPNNVETVCSDDQVGMQLGDNAEPNRNSYLFLQDRIKTQITVLENLEVEISKVMRETAESEEILEELDIKDKSLENELSEIMLVDWPEQRNICENQVQQAHGQLLSVTKEVELHEMHLKEVKKKVEEFKSFIQTEEKEDGKIDDEVEKWNELFQRSLHNINCNINLH